MLVRQELRVEFEHIDNETEDLLEVGIFSKLNVCPLSVSRLPRSLVASVEDPRQERCDLALKSINVPSAMRKAAEKLEPHFRDLFLLY
ncbi:hypothetical protein UCDDS831_g00097 [Diplodia seriata]|uniref:Uncharacterized protein n=1 Tax=Diplodia seriata TaxID=420778 RepID=A0A0G2F1M8_9PEZI|nr:hypothetical protein UCDDS831_g00097 [Diplodia seriata]